jgi:hypothetical protein
MNYYKFNPGFEKGHFFLIFSFLILSSCYKDVLCERDSFYPGFSGYSLSDFEGAQILYYSLNKPNSSPFDSIKVYTSRNWKYNVVLEASIFTTNWRFDEGFEMEIKVPKINKTYRISNIIWETNTRKCRSNFEKRECKGLPCLNNAIKCAVNGNELKFENYLNNKKVVIIPK